MFGMRQRLLLLTVLGRVLLLHRGPLRHTHKSKDFVVSSQRNFRERNWALQLLWAPAAQLPLRVLLQLLRELIIVTVAGWLDTTALGMVVWWRGLSFDHPLVLSLTKNLMVVPLIVWKLWPLELILTRPALAVSLFGRLPLPLVLAVLTRSPRSLPTPLQGRKRQNAVLFLLR